MIKFDIDTTERGQLLEERDRLQRRVEVLEGVLASATEEVKRLGAVLGRFVDLLQFQAKENDGKLSSIRPHPMIPSPWELYWQALTVLCWESGTDVHPDPPIERERE